MKAAASYQRAEQLWSDEDLVSAFRLFLMAARAGYVPAYDIVAHFYATGKGTKIDQDASLQWYMRSFREHDAWYRRGKAVPANNIGCIWRDRNQPRRALAWFKRAAMLGDGDAYLNIALIYLQSLSNPKLAIRYLRKTIAAPNVTDASIEEAKALLKRIGGNKRPVAK